jgi:hypothetical protein
MTRNLLYLVASALLFYACTRPVDNNKVEVSYDTKNFRLESVVGCASGTMDCAYYEVKYPQFSGLDTAVLQQLVKRMDEAVSMGNPEADGQSMTEIGQGFIKDYLDFRNEIPDISGGWYYSGDITVEVLTDTLLSLTVKEEYFTGGAHGGYGTYFINIDPRTGADFTLSNLLKPGFEVTLTNLGEKSFRKVRELPDTSSFMENYFEFPDDKFVLNQNFGFTNAGIVFYFNSYEIAPYASGPTEVLIPYGEIKAWLR